MSRALGSSRVLHVVVVVLVFAVIAIVAVLRYQPLERAGSLIPGSDMEVVTIEEFEEVGAHVLRYTDEGYVTYAFTVRNTGPLGVTVTGLPLPEEAERRLLQPVTAGVATADSAEAADMEPFEPFALGVGEEQRIIVQARMDNCEYYTERAIEIVESQRIAYRTGGLPRTTTVAFDQPLLVRSPTIKRCPERTLDRAEHRRTEP